MADAFDVSLRVKLDYQASAPARAATGDLQAIEAAAKRLGASSTVLAVARDMGALRQAATVAKAGLDELAAAGRRLGGTAGSNRLAADIGAVARPAAEATRQINAAATAATALGHATRGISSGDGLTILSRDAVAARRSLTETASAAASLEREVDALVRSASAGLKPLRADQLAAGFAKLDAQAKAGVVRLGELEEAVAHVGAATGPTRLAEAVGAVAPAAVEARRELGEVGRAAVAAARDVETLGRARQGGGGGAEASAGGGHGGAGDGGGGRGHAGPNGWRGAAIAAARPLRMERLVMSAMTPVGLAGLGAGLGVAGVAHQIEDATRRAVELEDAMNNIRRSTGTMSAEGVKGLEGEILRTSRATGQTSVALARMGAEAAAAGRPAADLPRFMDFGAKAAGAFGAEVDQVGSQLTKIGSDFGLDQRGVERAANAAALLQERTGARGAGTLDFMAQTGGAAHLAGMAPEQLAAFGGTMGKLGIADPASTFSGLLQKLVNAPNESSLKNGLVHLPGPDGHTSESPWALRNTMLRDPSSGMMRFLADVKQLPDQRRQFVLGEMFGSEDAEKIARLADHLDDLKKNLGSVQDTAARNGAVERVFSVFDEATSKKIDRATEAIGAFATKIGQHFAPAMGAAADATTRFFGGWLDKMDRLQQVGEIAEKIAKGVAPTGEQQQKLDADPSLKAQVQSQIDAIGVARANDRAASPDPEAGRRREMDRIGGAAPASADAAAGRERDRLKLVEAIRAETVYARDHGGVGADDLADLKAAYAAQYPDQPLPAFARGGRVTGAGGPREDRVLARLSPGEFVVNAEAAAKHQHLVRAINDNALPAYADGGSVGGLGAPIGGRSDPAAMSRLEDTIAKGVKTGVVAGLRDARDMPGTASSGAASLGVGSEGDGDAGTGEGGGRTNLRFGRATGASNFRYGRASGGGYRNTPSSRARGSFRGTPGGRHGGGAGPSAYGQAGGWKIGSGDGTATADNAGPGFTAGMKARNLGNIGYFGQHDAGLVGPSNAHDVDHPIAMYATQEDGVRAAARLALRKYQGGMHSTWDLIAGRPVNGHATMKGAWTPGSLGGGASVNIAKAMGLSNQDDLHLDQPAQMHKFLRGLAMQEHGSAGAYYSDAMIDRALKGGGPTSASANAERTVPGTPDRRGFANLMHGQFGAPGENLTSIATPGGHKVTVHREAAASFQGFLGDLEKSGYNINSLGGYANRGMAGNPNHISQHAYGNAIDINPAQNPFHTSQTNLPKNVSDMAAKWGLSWGGDWSERSRDPMHFEWTGARPWEHQAGPTATAANKPNVMPFGLTGTALAAMDKARAEKAAASAAAAGEDRATRSTAAERQAAAAARPPLSPRFTPAGMKLAHAGDGAPAGGATSPASGRNGAGTPPAVVHQNFYGQHDPRETAMHARRESNREIKRAQARALHGVGRPA